MNEYDATETQRIMANLIRIGKISALDETTARVKVDVAGLTTDWLPWAVARAGSTRTWSAPRIGEQVVVLSPYGDPAQGVVMPSLYQDDFPAPANSKDQEHTVYPDGTSIDYNSATNTYTMTVVGNAQVTVICKNATVQASEAVTLDTPLTHCTGALTVDGVLTYKAGMVGQGGATTAAITGNIAVTGNIGVQGNITASGSITDGDGDGGA